MRLLFVVADLFYSEPLGVLYLAAVCKQAGHQARLAVLAHGNFRDELERYQPDMVCYSVMTPNILQFQEADVIATQWSLARKSLFRIMGGPHPTYFPNVLKDMNLDAICRGDGEHAFESLLQRLSAGEIIEGIPNIATQARPLCEKKAIQDISRLPHPDREILYSADPLLQEIGIRSFLTMRGCPFKCTYCFNHAYNAMFKTPGGKVMRRRTVDDLLTEIRRVIDDYPTCRLVRFADDVFLVKPDQWFEEFCERYPKEVGIPFYCLLRATNLTEKVAAMLQHAGCVSLSMSIEAGSEYLRNRVLKRHMSDDSMRRSFALARKYNLNTYANTILALPGSTPDDDFASYEFAKSLRSTVPTFGIFSPFPGTDLTRYALEIGVLDSNTSQADAIFVGESVLANYSQQEKKIQVRLMALGPIFCHLPSWADKLLYRLVRLPLTPLYNFIGATFLSYRLATKCFPNAYPRNILVLLRALVRSLRFFKIAKRGRATEHADDPSHLRAPSIGMTSPDY